MTVQWQDAREEPVKLATLLLSDVKFCACADETLNGHDNLVNMINQLDDGTSVPHQLRWEFTIHMEFFK